MKLFGHPDSGHAFKVKFFLEHFEYEHQYEIVDIFSPQNARRSEFMKASKFGEVPTLIDGNNHYIQSNAILVYLSEKYGHFNDTNEKSKCLQWLMWESNKIGMCLPQLRANRKFSVKDPTVELSQGAYDWLYARYVHDVNVLDKELANSKYILGEHVSTADFSLCGYLMYAHEAEVEVPQNVETWLRRLKEINGWQDPHTMLKG